MRGQNAVLAIEINLGKLRHDEQAMVRSTTNGGQHHKSFGLIGTFDDFRFELRQEFRKRF